MDGEGEQGKRPPLTLHREWERLERDVTPLRAATTAMRLSRRSPAAEASWQVTAQRRRARWEPAGLYREQRSIMAPMSASKVQEIHPSVCRPTPARVPQGKLAWERQEKLRPEAEALSLPTQDSCLTSTGGLRVQTER